MGIKRGLSSMGAALALLGIFPALASAHILTVAVGPSQCVSPLNGSYSATVTVTERYFGATTEDIPVGQNVRQLASSTDRGNFGINQNYFTQGAVGTQTGPANLGQPTSFTSPPDGNPATQQFTVTTSVPETYVLANSYMRQPSTATIHAPEAGCTPPPVVVSASATTACAMPLNGTYTATIDIAANEAFDVAAGSTGGPAGTNFLSPAASGQPSSFAAGDAKFTVGGLTQPTVYLIGAPGGNVATVALTAPSGGCQPPTPPPATVSVTATTRCTAPLNGTYSAIIDVHSSAAFKVAPGSTGGNSGSNFFSSQGSGEPSSFQAGDTAFPVTGLTQPTAYVIGAPGGEIATVTLAAPSGACQPPAKPPVACVAPKLTYRVRGGHAYAVTVRLRKHGKAAGGAKVIITLPRGRHVTRTASRHGTVTFTVKPTRSGALYVQSTTCSVRASAKVTPVRQPPTYAG